MRAVVDDVLAGVSPGAIALSFHRGIAEAVAAAARAVVPQLGAVPGFGTAAPVVLGGGVFANSLLLRLTSQALRRDGFAVLRPRLLPPNDGGLAIGQFVIGSPRPTDPPRPSDMPRPAAIEGSPPCV